MGNMRINGPSTASNFVEEDAAGAPHRPRYHFVVPDSKRGPFDPNGAFVAADERTAEVVGYVLSFRRRDQGYISVVAVAPGWRRQGIGAALVRTAVNYLRGLGLQTIKIDAYADAAPAVNLYSKLGFRIEETFEDDGDE